MYNVLKKKLISTEHCPSMLIRNSRVQCSFHWLSYFPSAEVTGCGLEMGLVPTFSKEFSLQLHALACFKGCPACYPVDIVVFFCRVKVAGECSKHCSLVRLCEVTDCCILQQYDVTFWLSIGYKQCRGLKIKLALQWSPCNGGHFTIVPL